MYAAYSEDFRSVQAPLQPPAKRPRATAETLPRKLLAGQHLFYESDRADTVYEVVSGVFRMSRVEQGGRRQVIAFGFPGDLIGLPGNGRHTTECEAATSAEVIAHRIGDLARPDRNPELHALIMTAALDEIRMLQDHFVMIGRRPASEKVAAFLTLLLERIGEPRGAHRVIRLPMNRSDIADFLGLTPETISRSITQLRSQRVIALEDALTMIVLDPARLRALSDGI